MLDLLYLCLLYPLEVLMEWCLKGSYVITQSYGWSIVVLSLCVNFCILPIYALAEHWQQQERNLKSALQPGIRHIKQAFKGQERFAMLRTLYRQHHYHPIMGLRTSLGLLIQIPFFFAAFHFLSHYRALDGVAFLWFDDLSLPDGLLQIGQTSINIMPVVMTAINLCSAHVYGKTLARNERFQFHLLAAVFLVLLYNSPVGLVLYWTVNNAFSLAKNLISRKIGSFALGPRVHRVIQQITLPPLALVVVVVVLAISIGTILAGLWPSTTERIITFASFALSVYLSILATGVFIKSFSFSVARQLRALVIVALYAFTSFYLFDALSTHQYYLSFEMERQLVWLGCGLIVLLSLLNLSSFADRYPLTSSRCYSLFLLSSVLGVSVIFIFAPISLYVSDVTVFSASVLEILTGSGSMGILVLLGLSLSYVVTPASMRGYYALAMICVAALTCLYTFVFVGDYGSIDFFSLDPQELVSRKSIGADALIIAITATLAYRLFKKDRWKLLAQVLGLLLLTVLLVSGYQLYDLDTPLTEGHFKANQESRQALAPLPQYNADLMNFSRQEKNVVIIMLDAFNAYTLPELLRQKPALREELDGFVWYRNTLTTGYVTALGEPGIHGGHHYTAPQIARREYKDVSEETAAGYRSFSDSFGDAGFDVSYAGVQNTRCELIDKHSRVPPRVCVGDTYVNDYAMSIAWPGKPETSMLNGAARGDRQVPYQRVLPAIGAFRAAPFALKELIYDDGRWMGSYPLAQKSINGAKLAAQNLAGLFALAQLGTASSSKGTFKYIQNNITHRPYFIDPASCLPALKESDDDTARECALRPLLQWLRWLRREGIYDNTMIVLVSDHGPRKFGFSLGIPLSRANALLMVKDLGQHGPLEHSDVFMSNADVPSIVCEVIGGCENIEKDPRHHPVSRTLYLVKGTNMKNYRRISEDNTIYQVKDSIFDPSNWSIVD